MHIKAKRGWLALLAALYCGSAAAELAVIAHPSNPVSKASRGEVSELYLGQNDTLGDGDEMVAIDQAAESPAHQQFIKSVLNMSEGELKSYWSRLMFSGKAQPPKSLANDQEVKEWVAKNPDAIGFVDKKAVDNSVKVLLILP